MPNHHSTFRSSSVRSLAVFGILSLAAAAPAAAAPAAAAPAADGAPLLTTAEIVDALAGAPLFRQPVASPVTTVSAPPPGAAFTLLPGDEKADDQPKREPDEYDDPDLGMTEEGKDFYRVRKAFVLAVDGWKMGGAPGKPDDAKIVAAFRLYWSDDPFGQDAMKSFVARFKGASDDERVAYYDVLKALQDFNSSLKENANQQARDLALKNFITAYLQGTLAEKYSGSERK